MAVKLGSAELSRPSLFVRKALHVYRCPVQLTETETETETAHHLFDRMLLSTEAAEVSVSFLAS